MHAVGMLLLVHLAATLLTALVAAWAGTPFTLWFRDTLVLLVAVLVLILLLGVIWDGSLIAVGLVAERLGRKRLVSLAVTLSVESMRERRFFTCGITPVLLVVLTAYAILGTSNITLISLKLLGGVTDWRDVYFWRLEAPIFDWLKAFPVDTLAWDRLYHSCWLIELSAAFALVVIGRSTRIMVQFCLSLVLLFYLGRFLGMLNPVMGPAIYRPEWFPYLHGSLTGVAMQQVASVIANGPAFAFQMGGVLLGGVSAMPSLHVAMVAVTAYWLGVAKSWTALISIPWVILIWISTVVLGWHYILDGAGGLILAAVSVWLAKMVAIFARFSGAK